MAKILTLKKDADNIINDWPLKIFFDNLKLLLMLFLYNIPRILKPLILSCIIFSFAPAPDQSLQAK